MSKYDVEPSLHSAGETIQLVTNNPPVSFNSQTETRKADLLTRRTSNEHCLMRWCALLLSLSTLIIVWRYITILILSLWLSGICRPILEWLLVHLWEKNFQVTLFTALIFRPLINRCREKRSRSAVAAFLLVFLVLVVILPIASIIITLMGSTINFVANISNSTTVRNAINLIVPPTNDNSTKSTTLNKTDDVSFADFIRGGKNTTVHLFERLLIQRDTMTNVLQLFGGKALSVISTVAGATAQVKCKSQFENFHLPELFLVRHWSFNISGVDLYIFASRTRTLELDSQSQSLIFEAHESFSSRFSWNGSRLIDWRLFDLCFARFRCRRCLSLSTDSSLVRSWRFDRSLCFNSCARHGHCLDSHNNRTVHSGSLFKSDHYDYYWNFCHWIHWQFTPARFL